MEKEWMNGGVTLWTVCVCQRAGSVAISSDLWIGPSGRMNQYRSEGLTTSTLTASSHPTIGKNTISLFCVLLLLSTAIVTFFLLLYEDFLQC